MSRPTPLQVANVLAKKPISGRRHGTRGRQIVRRNLGGEVKSGTRSDGGLPSPLGPVRTRLPSHLQLGLSAPDARRRPPAAPGSNRPGPPLGFVGLPRGRPRLWRVRCPRHVVAWRPCHERLPPHQGTARTRCASTNLSNAVTACGCVGRCIGGNGRDRAGVAVGRASQDLSF